MSMSRARPGFTIVEMLVVLSIIVLLVAILMPSFARAREQARRAICAANQHQIFIAVNGYAKEQFGKYPHNVMNTDNNPPTYTPKNEHITWVSQGTFDYMMEAVGQKDDVLYCPNKRDWEVVQTRWAYGQSHKAYRLGYFYMFGHTNFDKPWTHSGPWGTEQQNISNGSVARWLSPQRLNEAGDGVFTTDIIESGTQWPRITSAAHGQIGSVETEDVVVGVLNAELNTAGSMIGRVDGSVSWKFTTEMVEHFNHWKGLRRGWW